MNKTAIITGGSKGIGFAIALELGKEGYNIVVFSRHPHAENFRTFEELGIPYLFVPGDISKKADRENLLENTLNRFASVEVLVNNAGVAPLERNDILQMTEESYDRVMDINTKGNMFMTQLVSNQMIKQEIQGSRRGTIINISSCSAVISSPNRAEYCVSKAGISMLTTLFADRLSKEQILVHEIRPGVIKTDMTSEVDEKYEAMFNSGVFPIARWGQPQDIANIVSFMVSEKFCYTTGDYIDVDGGYHFKSL
jgi:NAD(P)-dependent dehydrogenase (short-subunit alcohol dehydrogenase family)